MYRPLLTTAALMTLGFFVSVSRAEDTTTPPPAELSPGGDTVDHASNAPEKSNPTEPDSAKISAYGVAYDFAWRIKPYYVDAGWEIDFDMLMQGIKDALADNAPKYSEAEINDAVTKLKDVLVEKDAVAQQKMQAEAHAAIAKDAQFLEENKAKPGVTTTASGLQIEYLRQGDGPMPMATDRVKVQYKGTFTNGNTFDSTYDTGEPAVFSLSQVIDGLREGIMLTRVGGKSRLVIPYDLAYGEAGRPPAIPGKAALVFEIELLGIVNPADGGNNLNEPAETTTEPATADE